MENNTYNSENQGFMVDMAVEEKLPAKSAKKQKTTLAQELFEWLDIIITAIITVVIIFTLVFRVATISGPSMENTLYGGNAVTGEGGDKVIITNFAYTPKQGDIVVISRNADNSVEAEDESDVPIIKRVIAVEGQTVDINFESGVVSVDGVELDEPYTKTPTNVKHDIEFPVYVPEGCIFVLGDNRNESLDSRSASIGENGMIDTRYVLGKAVFRIFPFERIGGLYK